MGRQTAAGTDAFAFDLAGSKTHATVPFPNLLPTNPQTGDQVPLGGRPGGGRGPWWKIGVAVGTGVVVGAGVLGGTEK